MGTLLLLFLLGNAKLFVRTRVCRPPPRAFTYLIPPQTSHGGTPSTFVFRPPVVRGIATAESYSTKQVEVVSPRSYCLCDDDKDENKDFEASAWFTPGVCLATRRATKANPAAVVVFLDAFVPESEFRYKWVKSPKAAIVPERK